MARFLDFEGVDAVLFDCDGVLVDSEPVSEWSWRTTLSEVGVELGDFSEWVGKTDQALAIHFAGRAGLSPSRLAERAGVRLIERLEAEGVEVFSDARVALQRAAEGGMAMAVVSNSEGWRLDAMMEAAGLGDFFSVRVSSDDVARPKPSPDIYVRAAEMVAVAPSRCLVVEDTPTGVAAARAAGMRVVAVDRKVFDPEALVSATRVIDSMAGAADRPGQG